MKISSQIFILILLFISLECFSNTSTLDLSTQLNTFLNIQQTEIAEKGYRSDYEVGNIDPRFNEKECTTPLEFSLNRSPFTQSNLTVLAACTDKTPWKIYITTKFYIYGDVVYASNTLPRSTVIQRQDIEVKQEAINNHHYASFSDINDVIGMIAKRSIRHGSVIQANLLQAPKLIKRGDDVVIMASTQGIMIKMRGTAMQDGELGQQISVKNNQSERIVKARVSESGLVSVTL
jgi:flagella basal body P-ring formation protein FlgA